MAGDQETVRVVLVVVMIGTAGAEQQQQISSESTR